ncbi:MAG: HEAT repeat domain-containing protein [Polyangiaceae bacterium]|nr:HEAT repeat domain-containing protein [Polyangiaceae bacterium]MCW5791563.1 HEAT repeat domain-containing protein [Polyangiaceae bacterium]
MSPRGGPRTRWRRIRIAFGGVVVGLMLTAPAEAFVWPGTAERIERALGSSAPAERRVAAARLTELPHGSARRLTLIALRDADVEVRVLAGEAALALRLEGAGREVSGWLGDSDKRLRQLACEVLAVSPEPQAVPLLGRVLGDPEVGVRVAAARALGSSADGGAVGPLLGHLDDKSAEARQAVIEALSELADTRAVAPVIGKIQDANLTVRLAAVRALGRLGDRRAASALVLALRDPERSVRVAALSALGSLRAEEATQAVVTALEGESVVSQAAIQALGQIGNEAALQALFDALAVGDTRVTPVLAAAGEKAQERLRECLAGQSPRALAEGCASALALARDPEAPERVVAALQRGILSPEAGLKALGESGDERALPTVLSYLSHSSSPVRREAMRVAELLMSPSTPDGRAVEPIVQALREARRRPNERRALVSLLGRTGSPRAVPTLSPLARRSDDAGLRAVALEALGRIQGAPVDEVLLGALDSPLGAVRLAAALSLSRVASAKAGRPLLQRMQRASGRERELLALALGGALARSKDSQVLDMAFDALGHAVGREREALLDALSRSPLPVATERLTKLGAESTPDRATLAGTLGQAPKARGAARAALRGWALDPAPEVRAHAVWSLGQVGEERDLALLTRALKDPDHAVAGNAAGSLARLQRRTKRAKPGPLCDALADPRSHVRAASAAALAALGARCDALRERLLRDPSELVRERAARALAGSDSAADRAALTRCAATELTSSVAVACRASALQPSGVTERVLVHVVPLGGTAPAPSAPFTLVLADGLLRAGVADRRGAVVEWAAPRGSLELILPPALGAP